MPGAACSCKPHESGNWGIDRAYDASRTEFDPDRSVKLLSQAAFDEPRPEATPDRLLNVRPLRLLPHEVEALWRARAVQHPMYPDLAGTVGQGPVLHGIRGQLLERHGKWKGHARRHLDARSLHMDAVFSTAAVRFNGLCHDVMQSHMRPASVGEHIMNLRQCEEAALNSARGVIERGRVPQRL